MTHRHSQTLRVLRDHARTAARTALLTLSPGARIAFDHRAWRRGAGEEAALITLLAPTEREAVDVGANAGAVSWLLAKRCRGVWTFEPLPEFQYLAHGLPENCHCYNVALGSAPGRAELRVPSYRGKILGQLATMSPGNDLSDLPFRTLAVPVSTIDAELARQDVGFIKIDVEGHEIEVLRGAETTLARCHPRLVIESEDRHAHEGVRRLLRWLGERDYTGFFLWRGTLLPAFQFCTTTHQQRANVGVGGVRGPYANTFAFIHSSELSKSTDLLR